MKDNKKIKTFEQHQEKMNKKELRKLDKYQNEINLANDRIISAGFTIYGDLYINCEKSFSTCGISTNRCRIIPNTNYHNTKIQN